MHVVATAGHVDHGKSTLLRALTGMEPDRWEEERRRGLTLDLGFVWGPLGPGGGSLAFVDVPGHEKLVGNMLAGVGPVPAVLLVVAADQGWQPQSEEHLAIVDALGVRDGLLVVTRSDLADPGPVLREARGRVAESSLGRVEAVPVSAVSGEGMGALRAALVRLAAGLPDADREADVRLWADRVFTVRGRGTVVTGTLGGGRLRVGERLVVADGSAAWATVRVRGLQCLGEERAGAEAVARVAVDVHGAGAGRLRRGGALVTPGRWAGAELVDVRVRGDEAGALPRRLVLHVGAAAVPVGVRPLGRDTVRLSLGRSLPLRVGDRALLRDPGLHRVAGGVTVLDVRPPRLARRGAAAARAVELEGMSGVPDGADEVRRRGLVRGDDLLAMGVPAAGVEVADGWFADPAHWAGLGEQLEAAVAAHAARHPLDPGLSTEAARRALGLPERALVDALLGTRGARALRQREGKLYGEAELPRLPAEVREAVEAVRRDLAAAPFRAPEAGRLAELGLRKRELAAACAAEALWKVADGIVLLPGADVRAAEVLAGLGRPFTLSEARQALDTSRRVAVPLLECLDRQGRTERLDDVRRRCRTAGRGQ